MSIFRRGQQWHVDIANPNGGRIRQSAGTTDRKQAQEYHDRLKDTLWRQTHLNVKARRTWDELALQWLRERGDKDTICEDAKKIAWLNERWSGKYLDELTRVEIHETVEQGKRDCAKATRNRYYALIRAMLRAAVREWEWIDAVPAIKLHKERDRRVRYLTPEQAKLLLSKLPDGHLRDAVAFALATGLRAGNIHGLRWEWVDLDRRMLILPHRVVKNDEDLAIPLNDVAVELLRAQQGKHKEWVFTYRGERVKQLNTKAWKTALVESGISDFRFHDLRHTWASWLAMSGDITMHEIQEMGGWKSATMVRRYAHLSTGHLMRHAKKLDAILPRQVVEAIKEAA